MDILSSMANIAGYKSAIEAADEFHRFFPGQITAKILIIGGGVAGLSACGTAKNMGAIAAVKEHIESLGAQFVTVEIEKKVKVKVDIQKKWYYFEINVVKVVIVNIQFHMKKYMHSNGVKIIGYTDFPSRLAAQSSTLLANNIVKFLGKQHQLI